MARHVNLVLLLLGLILSPSLGEIDERERDPDIDLTVPELIVKYGYPVETHVVTTEDGYALGVHRIPHGRNEARHARADRPAVFVQHGLTASSSCWILNGVENSLAYMLADAGFDVWLGNARGNVYSRLATSEHDPDTNDYWKFSWHEGGVYDLPAVIDHILETTGQQKVFYVGHSMGTTMFYVMAAERPEYNDKIAAMVSLAPVAYMSHLDNILVKLLAPASSQIGWLLNLMGVYEFLPQSDFLKEIGQLFCNEDAVFKELCENVAFLILGADSKNLDVTKIPFYLNNMPQGCSTRMFVHYGQEYGSGKFRRYDFGWLQNLINYGSISPPKYDTSKITAPVALFYGDNDNLADPIDVTRLNGELPNSLGLYKVPQEGFTHLDFIIHADVASLINEPIIELFQKIRNGNK
ncbi:lipase 3-like [Periplaneta americana]|uniref:lipase 3-like n=1 Tax=Periplaneta americana TaxID=6978 RepID=UPI0037E85476